MGNSGKVWPIEGFADASRIFHSQWHMNFARHASDDVICAAEGQVNSQCSSLHRPETQWYHGF